MVVVCRVGRELGHEVSLSHLKQTKAIAHARLKSDKADAVMLARLLKADFLPTVWIPRGRQRYRGKGRDKEINYKISVVTN